MRNIKQYFAVALFLSAVAFVSCFRKPLPEYMSIKGKYVNVRGFALGTSYSVTYFSPERIDLNDSIKALLDGFENSLSIYRENSIISKVNRNEETVLDNYFTKMFNRSKEIARQTDNAFDIAGAPFFEIWGWGAKNRIEVSPRMIDSISEFAGIDKISIVDGKIIKTDPRVSLNANAIAKGFSADVIAEFLNRMKIADYLVEIGGEMTIKGKNPKGEKWKVAIDNPEDGNYIPGRNIRTVLAITDRALATSGNYRRFYIENGEKFSHTIDPRTGYQSEQNILSASVSASDCMTADAFATAFMVLGLDKSKEILDARPELDAYLIYFEDGEEKVYFTDGMTQCIID